MNVQPHWLHLALIAATIGQAGGCCCACRLPINTFARPKPVSTDIVVDDGPADAGASAEPVTAEELSTARDYAQKALSNKGYGAVNSAKLRKDGINWYVDGTAGGKGGGTVNYEVWFMVTQAGNRMSWSVQALTVDGEVVYP